MRYTRMFLFFHRRLGTAGLGLILAAGSFAPAPPEPTVSPDLKKLAEARYLASLRAYEESWTYYRQARTDPFFTYSWSRIVMTSQGDLSDKKADRLAAMQGHLQRMKKLETLVKKVRQIGFQRSIDIVSSDYFVREAEYWIARAKTEDKPVIPPSNTFPFPSGG